MDVGAPAGWDDLRPSSRLQLIRTARTSAECWSLLDPYVELVWVEALGATAVAVVRRLELLMTADPPAHATSLAALATPLRVPPGKVLRSLRRLHHHGLLLWREEVGVIGLSGFTRSVEGRRIAVLSPYGARLHRALTCQPPPPAERACPSLGVELER
jgi:hypothetical protein